MNVEREASAMPPGLRPTSRARRRVLRTIMAMAIVTGCAAGIAWFSGLGPVLRHAVGSGDEAVIDYERAKRRWLATWGVAMPGAPDTAKLPQRLAEHGLTEGAPLFIRIFKREFELELWMKRDEVFHRFAIYPICRWSGDLGPKLRQGDHQTPEGFYTVDASALNPNSNWYRSFNIGFPNVFDRAHLRTGSFIMVHGGCASVGCFAMTNAQMGEIWHLVTAALGNGQKRFQVQVLPFRMSEQSLAAYAGNPNVGFWRSLKVGSDLFDTTLLPPRITVCDRKYVVTEPQPGSIGDASIEQTCQSVPART